MLEQHGGPMWIPAVNHLTFSMVMFHVKLSTALCNFLPFNPSFKARSWRFSWNSMAGRERQMRSVILCGWKSWWCVRQTSSCEVAEVWEMWLGAKPVVTVRKHVRAQTPACPAAPAVDEESSLSTLCAHSSTEARQKPHEWISDYFDLLI